MRSGDRSKYGAKKVQVDGYIFDSKMEARRYGELRLIEKAGKICGLVVHPKFSITIQGKPICIVELDFCYAHLSGTEIYEDVKGFDTAISKLKRKLVEAAYGFKVTVIRKETR